MTSPLLAVLLLSCRVAPMPKVAPEVRLLQVMVSVSVSPSASLLLVLQVSRSELLGAAGEMVTPLITGAEFAITTEASAY